MTKLVETVSTKVTKYGAAKATVLTVDFTEAPLELIMGYAMQAIKVKVQGRFRQDGIPSAYTFVVRDNPVGVKVPAKPTVESTKAAIETLSKEEKLALLATLMQESKDREERDEAELEAQTKPE